MVTKHGSGDNYITRSFMICISPKYRSVDDIKKTKMGGAYSTYVGDEMHTGFRRKLCESQLEDLAVGGRIILKRILSFMGIWTRMIWLRTGTGGGHL